MCIRDRSTLLGLFGTIVGMIEIFGSQTPTGGNPGQLAHGVSVALYNTCLLYTSDAADERSSVDLGGRRII